MEAPVNLAVNLNQELTKIENQIAIDASLHDFLDKDFGASEIDNSLLHKSKKLY